MKRTCFNCFIFLGILFSSCSVVKGPEKKDAVYIVKKVKKPMPITGDWNKSEWKKVSSIELTNFMGPVPAFQPKVQVKIV